MTRLLYIPACIASFLAVTQGTHVKRHGHSGNGYSSNGYSGGNAEVIDITYDVVPKAQDGSTPVQNVAAPMSTSGMKHVVIVGGDAGKVFTPNTLKAAIGDMIHFQFLSINHTVTQSTFAKPCVRMEGGVDSGFKPNPDNSMSPPPTWMFQVKDKKPTWFYCRAKGHCGAGMAFSINPSANKTQAQFLELAKQQNGTVSAGSSGAGIYSAPPAAASVTPASSPAALSAPPPANLAAPSQAPAGSMVSGSGGGQCACSCLCGTAAFPVGAGIGMYGGMPGAVPAS